MSEHTAIDTLLTDVGEKRIKPRAAMAALVKLGFDPDDAEQAVFVALGGGDLLEAGEDGLERYRHSGRLAREVQAEMET